MPIRRTSGLASSSGASAPQTLLPATARWDLLSGQRLSERNLPIRQLCDGTFQPQDTFNKPLSWVFAEENFNSMPTTFQFGADVSTGWDFVDRYFGLVGSALESLFGGTHCTMPPQPRLLRPLVHRDQR
jgi:hypothetical protein